MQSRLTIMCVALLAIPTTVLAAEKPKLIFQAELSGNADLAVTAGGQKIGKLLPTAKFVPGIDGRGQAIISTEAKKYAVELPMTGNFLPRRGTIMFWFQPQHQLGYTERDVFDPIHCRGRQGFRVRIQSFPDMANFIPVVHSGAGAPMHAGVNYKFLLTKKWYHVTYTWDTDAQAVGSYTFGRPEANRTSKTDVRLAKFDPGKAVETMWVGSPHIAIADLRIYDRSMTGAQIRRAVHFKPQHSLGAESVNFRQIRVDVDAVRGKLIYENTFNDAGALAGWRMEGPGLAKIDQGQLWMHTTLTGEEKGRGNIVYWCPNDFPESFICEWDFTPTKLGGLCIVFFCAKGREGQDLFDPKLKPRSGNFAQYIKGDIDCYHISYFRNSSFLYPRTNMRKNHGFFLVEVGADFIPVKPGVTSKITLIKQKDHIRFLTNDIIALDFLDDGKTFGPVLGSGKIGLRQMGATWPCLYDNFRVYAVKE